MFMYDFFLHLGFVYSFKFVFPCQPWEYTASSIKVVHAQSGKVEYERERLLGIALKIY
jgi:hypothetical protein